MQGDPQRRSNWRIAGKLARAFLATFVGKVTAVAIATLLLAWFVVWLGMTGATAASWFAAIGTIFAAAAALNIATRDRKERVTERDEADYAQMRLVQIEYQYYDDSSQPNLNFAILVTNYGQRPILQVRVATADLFTWEDFGRPGLPSVPSYSLRDPGPVPSEVLVLPHVELQLQMQQQPAQRLLVRIADRQRRKWQPPRQLSKDQPAPTIQVEIGVECLDADGHHWMLSNLHGPQKNVPIPSRPVLERLWVNRSRFRQWLNYRMKWLFTHNRFHITLVLAGLVTLVVWRRDLAPHFLGTCSWWCR